NVAAATTAAGAAATAAKLASGNAVQYDSTTHASVTFGGTGAAVALKNVAAGKDTTDAVNMGQLTAMGAKFDSTGQMTNAFVAYDSAAKTSVSLGNGTAGVQIHQVAAGTADTDAVNFKQLNAMTSSLSAVTGSLKYIRFGASVGQTAIASGTDSIAFGGDANANGLGSLAIGRKSTSSGINAMAFGLGSNASADNSIALGAGSLATDTNTVSVGNYNLQRRIVNVADGQDAEDAVNLGQVEALIGAANKAPAVLKATRSAGLLGDGLPPASLTPDQLMKTGATDKVDQIDAVGTDAIAMGLNVHATQDGAVAIGQGAGASGNNAVSIGVNTVSAGDLATAIGVNAQAMGDRSLAIGRLSSANGDDTIAVGNSNIVDASAAKAAAFGFGNTVVGAGSVVIGNSNKLSTANTFVLGSNITGTDLKGKGGTNSIILGAGSDGSQSNVLSIGAAGSERKIVNVAAGSTTTDAVNYGQMTAAIKAAGTGGTGGDTFVTQAAAGSDLLVGSETDGTHVNFAGKGGASRELINVSAGTTDTSAVNLSQLKPAVAALGGGAGIDASGKVTGPTYSIGGKDKHTVGDAFTAVDTNLTTLNSTVAGITAGGTGLVVQDPATGDITVGALLNGSKVNFAGSAGDRVLTGVADGAITSSSSDAVNGKQIAGISSSFATAIGGGSQMNTDGSVTIPTFTVGGKTVNNVGDAINSLDTNISSLDTRITNISNAGGVATPNAVAYDSAAKDTLTLGTADQKTTLTNLKDGDISTATSTDAVTGGQLYTTNQNVADLTQKMINVETTGSTSIGVNGANGADGQPGAAGAAGATGADAIAMGDTASASGDHSVVIGGGATASGDGTTVIGGNGSATGANSTAIGSGSNATGANSVALGAGSVADRDNSVSVGSDGHERQITNVAAGTQGTDAVNLNQMNSAVGGIARKAYSGIAAATALTMIPDVDANKTLSIGIGGGTFQGYAATAIGGTARITQNIKVRVGAGWSAAGTTVGAGASYQW
ncbi:YadA-like family protein, partial [Caballeronia sordidicola]|uniref:YadA-like family protein n=1 Tax=Caballeronia sordidicola TaxID=196367 RepID=UPI0004D00AB1